MPKTVEEYYNELPQSQQEITSRLRSIIKREFPKLKETMKWGVPVFGDGMFYIVGLKDHVNLGFTISNFTKEEERLFEGGGKTTRKIEIRDVNDIDIERVKKLLNLTYKKLNNL